jgi:hypothetical protein
MFDAGEFAVQDGDQYEMVEVAGVDTEETGVISLRADTFLLFDGTSSAAEMPAASDASLVMKVTHAGGTVLTDSAVAVTGSTSIAMQAGSGNMAFTVTGGSHTVNADNGVTMESNAGEITFGGNNVNQPVSIATAGERVVTMGNSNANTAVNVLAGTGNMAFTVSSGSFNLDAGSGVAIETQASGSIVIGGDAGACSNPTTASTSAGCTSGWTAATGPIKVGTAGERTLTLGNTESSSALRIYAGSGGVATTVASGTYSLDTTGTIALESSAGEIQIGTDSVAQAVKIGTAGARAVTIGTSTASTASSLNLHAGTGNMATTVTGGTYSLDTTGNIALESSAGEILIGDDSVAQAIKIGTNGGRTITVGNQASSTTVNIKAHAIDATLNGDANAEFAVQDGDLYEMVEVAGQDAGTSTTVSLRADYFYLFDGTTSAAEMPAASDASLVMKVTHAGGTVLTDSAVAVTGSESGGVSITASDSNGNINMAASGGASSNVLISQGNLGINQATPTYALHIGSTGDDSGAVANSWNTYSDARLKTNVTSVDSGTLAALLRLRPVTFDWKNTSRHDLGFIAQELQQVFPLLVHEGPDGLLSVDYPRLNVYMARALQEEAAARREVAAELAATRAELRELREAVAELRELREAVE